MNTEQVNSLKKCVPKSKNLRKFCISAIPVPPELAQFGELSPPATSAAVARS